MRPGTTRASALVAATSEEPPALVLERWATRALAITSIAGSLGQLTPAAFAARPAFTDPLVVVDDFLLKRGMRDALGAAGGFTDLAEIQDRNGHSFADRQALRR